MKDGGWRSGGMI